MNKNQLRKFLAGSQRDFVREYRSLITVLAAHAGYRRFYPTIGAPRFSQLLVYKNKQNFEYYSLKKETERFENWIASSPHHLKKAHTEYLKALAELKKYFFKKSLTEKEVKKIFDLLAKAFALEYIVFLLPHLVLEHRVVFKDWKLVKSYQSARKKTENFFFEADRFIARKKLSYLPPYFKNFKASATEFLIFNEQMFVDTKTLKSFKEIKKLSVSVLGKEIKGIVAFRGKARGRVRLAIAEKDFKKINKGEIFVVSNTNPYVVPFIKKAAAIVADEGGLLCHAAIVSREFKIPCIIGTKIATQVLRDGDWVEVDANKGTVKILNK
ncbi:MAG: PEP-utilizing enzyme [Patescibacteria group bacterium]